MKAGHAGSTPPQGVLSEAALPERLARIDLNLLVAFDALAREQNVTRAAERVGVTQSAMSHALRRLRELLDDPLLVRGKSGMVLTARAEADRELKCSARRPFASARDSDFGAPPGATGAGAGKP